MFKLSTLMSCGVESLFNNTSSCGIFALKLISGLVPLYARSCETMSTPLLTSRTSTSFFYVASLLSCYHIVYCFFLLDALADLLDLDLDFMAIEDCFLNLTCDAGAVLIL